VDNATENLRGMDAKSLRRECELHYCSQPVRSPGSELCEGHYAQRRRGKPFAPLKVRRLDGEICYVSDCTNKRTKGRWCAKHEARIRRHGDPDQVMHQRDRNIPKGEAHPFWNHQGSYVAVHLRLRKARGRAKDHECVECQTPARQWALTHNRDKALSAPQGPFSLNLDDYEPMCVRCHKTMDMNYLRGNK
jgi:hypothetical protein